MNKNNLNNSRYQVTIGKGKSVTTETMTYEQVMQLNPQDVDHFMSFAFGVYAYRNIKGKWIEIKGGNWPGMGDTTLSVVQALQLNPGQFLSPEFIAEVAGCPSLKRKNVLSALLLTIRKIHGECYRYPNFFLSCRTGGFKIAWNSQKSFIWIERITPTKEQDA